MGLRATTPRVYRVWNLLGLGARATATHPASGSRVLSIDLIAIG